MRFQGHYTMHGPRIPGLTRDLIIVLAAGLIIAAGAAMIALSTRPSRAPSATTPEGAAPVAGVEQVTAPSRRFADEILAARAATDEVIAIAVAQAGPVTYGQLAVAPELWARCRPCADEALAALRMPAAPAIRGAAAVASLAAPDTRAIAARSVRFADEIIAGATIRAAASGAATLGTEAITPQSGPR